MRSTAQSSVSAALATTCLTLAKQTQATPADPAPSWAADENIVVNLIQPRSGHLIH